MIRLLAIDIDGTLLDSHSQLPDAHRDALVAANRRNIEVAIVTGRSLHFARPVAEALPLPLTLVVNNGAVVKDAAGVTRLRHLLARETARLILAQTRTYEDSVAVVFDRDPGDGERQILFERMDWNHPKRRGYFARNRQYIGETSGPLADVLTEDPIQVMFNGSVEPMRALVDRLRAMPIAEEFAIAVTEYEDRDFSMVDINGKGCSKGATLAKWAGASGITQDETMAVGDNLNDLEMLEFAGTAVVMGNASVALKERLPRAHVTTSNDEEGLAVALRRLLGLDTSESRASN
jgi:Cof subfamily protein (haloacid dehalogenase superfamily)